jgi:hypothetical protein
MRIDTINTGQSISFILRVAIFGWNQGILRIG